MPHVETWQVVVGLLSGVGIAAATGFRVFLPLLALALGARFGGLHLTEGFGWVTTDGAIVALASATVIEVLAFYVPWVDHALDTIAAPASVVAGTLAVASQAGSGEPWVNWVIGLVAGGGTAALVQSGTMLLRGVSLVATGGLANPVVATIENVGAVLLAVAAIVVPALAIVVLAMAAFLVVRWVMKRRRTGGNGALAMARMRAVPAAV